ncbi:baseplate wedge protein [Bacillus phage YungSlug]|nr:baseplate wedge protein [Bacillus phage YungSlug]
MRFLNSIFKREGANADHNAVIDGVTKALDTVDKDTDQMKNELQIPTATDSWLDEWGSWFGVNRIKGEADEPYRARILDVLSDKVTIPAIIAGVKKVLGDNTIVKVYEPFVDVRIFNRSTFSGKGKYQNKDYYRIGVIDIILNKPITIELIKYVNLIKAGGISVKFTYRPIPAPDQIVVDGTNKEETLSNTISMRLGEIKEQSGKTFSGSKPYMRNSGERVIWSNTKQEG